MSLLLESRESGSSRRMPTVPLGGGGGQRGVSPCAGGQGLKSGKGQRTGVCPAVRRPRRRRQGPHRGAPRFSDHLLVHVVLTSLIDIVQEERAGKVPLHPSPCGLRCISPSSVEG